MSWNLEEAIAYYKRMGAPADQNALIGLLREIQREHGGSIPSYALAATAESCGIKETLLRAIIRRIPSLRLGDMHCLELCSGPNCQVHKHLADFAEKSPAVRSGKVALKYAPCMRMCGKGPNIRWDGKLYHQADLNLLEKLLNE